MDLALDLMPLEEQKTFWSLCQVFVFFLLHQL